jgi:hypothetical protein
MEPNLPVVALILESEVNFGEVALPLRSTINQ